ENADYFFKKALRIEPGSSDALNNLGVLSCRNGDYDMARDYFMRSLDCNPGNEDAKVNLAALSEGIEIA
ncbi:MAG: tetratricopeptide repeat protein, partial [Nitrospiraceae bacterium]